MVAWVWVSQPKDMGAGELTLLPEMVALCVLARAILKI